MHQIRLLGQLFQIKIRSKFLHEHSPTSLLTALGKLPPPTGFPSALLLQLLTFCFPDSSKRLLQHLFCFNTHAKHPGAPTSHTSISIFQSFLCFSGFFRLSGITLVPLGANPIFRARLRASVPTSRLFFFLRILPTPVRNSAPGARQKQNGGLPAHHFSHYSTFFAD